MTSTTPRRPNTLSIPVLAICSALVVAVIGYIVATAICSATRADASHEVTIDEAFEPVGLTATINVRN